MTLPWLKVHFLQAAAALWPVTKCPSSTRISWTKTDSAISITTSLLSHTRTNAQTHACMQAQARTYAHTNAVVGIKATVFACTCREWYRRNLSITFLMARVALHDLRKRVGPTKRRNTPATWSQTPVNHLLESHLIRYKRQRHCVHWLGITLGVLKRDRFQIKQSPQKKSRLVNVFEMMTYIIWTFIIYMKMNIGSRRGCQTRVIIIVLSFSTYFVFISFWIFFIFSSFKSGFVSIYDSMSLF